MLDIKYSLYNLYLYRIDRIINNQFILFFKFIDDGGQNDLIYSGCVILVFLTQALLLTL